MCGSHFLEILRILFLVNFLLLFQELEIKENALSFVEHVPLSTNASWELDKLKKLTCCQNFPPLFLKATER